MRRTASLLLLLALAAGCSTPVRIGQPAQASGSPDRAEETGTVAAPVPSRSEPGSPGRGGPARLLGYPGGFYRQVAAPSLPSGGAELGSLEAILNEYLSAQEGTYGVFVIDLLTGAGASYHGDDAFPAASTFKLPVVIYALNQVGQGEAALEELLVYREEDWEAGTGILQASAEGDAYRLAYLLELAITYSDNIALNMLMRRFGETNIYAYIQALGPSVLFYSDETWGATPREMASLLSLAYRAEAPASKELADWFFGHLIAAAYKDRIPAGIPEAVMVANKIGTLPGVVNDVALVFAPDRPFILAAYSLDVDMEAAPGVIAEVARLVYTYLNPS